MNERTIALDPGGFNELRRCRLGPMIYNKNDTYVGASLRKYGEHSWLEHELLSQIIRPGQLLIEAGANIGAHTVGLSRLVGAGGAVLAFEPQRLMYQTLCANLALNQCANVHAFHQALGAVDGDIPVPLLDPSASNNFGGLSLVGATHGERVAVRTLDSFALPACHLIKADVEGMELDVVRGARRTIEKHRPVMYLENDRAAASAALLAALFDLDYRVYWHLPPLFNPANFAGEPENIFPGIVSVNVLCIPRSQQVTVEGLKPVASPTDSWRQPG